MDEERTPSEYRTQRRIVEEYDLRDPITSRVHSIWCTCMSGVGGQANQTSVIRSHPTQASVLMSLHALPV